MPIPDPAHDVLGYITSLRLAINKPFSMDMVMLVCWAIWKTRNNCIFQGMVPNLYGCRRIFKDELALLVHKATRKTYAGLADWVQRFH